MTARSKHWLSLLGLAILCLGALHPLLLIPHGEFGSDWSTHYFSIGYQSQYLRQHHWFPATLNVDSVVGLPYPVFYAVVFHPATAVLALAVGVDWAVRLLVLFVLATQIWQVRKLLMSVGSGEALAWVAAALMAWAPYAMTNLYTRGAMAEFVGVSLLISATASLVRGALGTEGRGGRLIFQGVFFYALCAGTHPITGLYGALFLAAVFAPFLFASWRRVLLPAAAGSFLVILVLISWLYALHQFRGQLTVDVGTMDENGELMRWPEKGNQIVHFPESIDAVRSRLWPWPRDLRVEQARSIAAVSTPYLDAQLSLPLLVLAMAVSWGMWRRRAAGASLSSPGLQLWVISWGIFLAAFLLSVWPALWTWMPRTLHMAQYAYRLVSYQNLALLTAIVGALLSVLREGRSLGTGERKKPWLGELWLGVLALAGFAGLVVMSSHISAVQQPPIWQRLGWKRDPDMFARFHPGFYGWWGYSILGENIDIDRHSPVHRVPLRVERGEEFGSVHPRSFQLEQPTNVCILVQPFPWNQIVLDGQPLEMSRVRTRPDGHVLPLPAGLHQVAYRWQPDPTWVRLDVLSKFAVLGGGLAVLFWGVWESRRAILVPPRNLATPP